MAAALLRYLAIWTSAFLPDARRRSPLNFQRFLILILGFPAFLVFQVHHCIFLLIDEVLFPAYRKVELKSPVFVSGVPRSGTTYVHRQFAATNSFTTLATWEAFFAPSITQRRIYKLLARLDRRMGSPFRKAFNSIVARQTREFSNIHAVELDAPEEDYLMLLPVAGCFIMVLLFPHSAHLWNLSHPEAFDAKTRQQLLIYYRAMLQRHVYASTRNSDPPKPLISKNAIFGAWSGYLLEMFPDAKFILCIREPETALRSQLSAIKGGVDFFQTDRNFMYFPSEFVTVYRKIYEALHVFTFRSSARIAVIDQQTLRIHSQSCLQQTAEKLGFNRAPDSRETVSSALQANRRTAIDTACKSKSKHQQRADEVDLSEFDEAIAEMQCYYYQLRKEAPLTSDISVSD